MQAVIKLTEKIIEAYKVHAGPQTFTVAVSGIDASGKGYISSQLEADLKKRGFKVANINIDPWQHPIPIRLKKENAAENVYQNIFRWNDFFEQLIFPLQKNKSIFLETKGIHSYADIYYPLVYDYRSVDIILVEGILLFKEKYLSFYDFKVWIDCSFETGLQRAIARNVEKLSRDKLISDYGEFYYAAQHLHFKLDRPRDNADLIFDNNHQMELV